MRTTLVVGTILCASVALPPRGQQVFRSGVQTVFADVSVMKGHAPVVDLQARDFLLADNGARQQIESVAPTAIPLDVSLVVDATHTGVLYGTGANAANAAEVQRSVAEIARTLRIDDRLRVITFAAEVVESRTMSPVAPTAEPVSLAFTEAFTNRYAITQALLTALTAPVAADRRHVVVLFALGSGKATVTPLDHLVPVAERVDAILYAVLPPPHHEQVTNRPFPFYPSEMLIRDAVTQAAEATGGKAMPTSDIVGAFRDVLKEFRSRYVLRYTLEGVPPAGWHDIVVKVPMCPSCTVRGRRGYMGQ